MIWWHLFSTVGVPTMQNMRWSVQLTSTQGKELFGDLWCIMEQEIKKVEILPQNLQYKVVVNKAGEFYVNISNVFKER